LLQEPAYPAQHPVPVHDELSIAAMIAAVFENDDR
jgi:hypothetical protein